MDAVSINNSGSIPDFGSKVLEKEIVGKDEFLKLLTFQLKNQNPMSPTENQEFAAQLAQFSQLEQLTDIRDLLEEQIYNDVSLNNTLMNSALPGLLGKTAKVQTGNFNYSGEDSVKLGYNLNQSASSVQVTIKDSGGAVVRTIDMNGLGLSKGEHEFQWDGTDEDGNFVPAGDYSFSVKATNSNGASYSADMFVNGKIEAVRFKAEGTFIVVNGAEMALSNLVDISS